jgi:hypothetical protein
MFEVGAAFDWQGYSLFTILFHPWALLLYGAYGAVTLAVAIFLTNQLHLQLSLFGWGITGLIVPQLTRLKLNIFSPISDETGHFHVSLAGFFSKLRWACFCRIGVTLADRRKKEKEALISKSQEDLLAWLRLVCSPEIFEVCLNLVQERRQQDPVSVKAFILSLLEKYDSDFPQFRVPEGQGAGHDHHQL